MKRGFGLQTEEDDLNDDSLTESIMEKMNSSSMSNDVPTIKVIDTMYRLLEIYCVNFVD